MRITVIVPVDRVARRVGDIMQKLLANPYEDKKLIVAVDGVPTDEIETAIEPYRDRVTVLYNNAQLGKAATLNRIALAEETDVLLMLDNDVELPDDANWLSNLARAMADKDIVEIPKEAVRSSVISRMMAFEFLSYAMTSLTMARWAGESPSMNGAAFAVRSELFRKLNGFAPVINEDMDFAARAFREDASFGYPAELKVRNDVPATVRDWFTQRKRWAMNNVLWLKVNFTLIVRNFFAKPALALSSAILMLPFLTYVMVYFLAKKSHITLLIPLLFLASQHFHALTGLLFLPEHLRLLSVDGWIATVVGAIVAAIMYFVFSRLTRFHFNILDFVCFYFFYSPIWLTANVVMFVAMLFKIDVKIDWNVGEK